MTLGTRVRIDILRATAKNFTTQRNCLFLNSPPGHLREKVKGQRLMSLQGTRLTFRRLSLKKLTSDLKLPLEDNFSKTWSSFMTNMKDGLLRVLVWFIWQPWWAEWKVTKKRPREGESQKSKKWMAA